MKLYLLAILLFTSEVYASDWVKVSTSKKTVTYVDAESYRNSETQGKVDHFHTWMRMDFEKPFENEDKKSPKKQYNQVLMYIKVYCEDNRFEVLSVTKQMDGQNVDSREINAQSAYVRPDTAFDYISKAGCSVSEAFAKEN